jgi:hypothetical protein
LVNEIILYACVFVCVDTALRDCLLYYWELKHGCAEGNYWMTKRNERSGIKWLRAGVRKVGGIRRGFERGRFPLLVGGRL